MNIRNRIEGVLLPHFHRIFPDADGKDLFFFGKKADIFSPIFFKKGIDIRPELVYNIFNEAKIDYIKLFSLVETSKVLLVSILKAANTITVLPYRLF